MTGSGHSDQIIASMLQRHPPAHRSAALPLQPESQRTQGRQSCRHYKLCSKSINDLDLDRLPDTMAAMGATSANEDIEPPPSLEPCDVIPVK